MYEFKAVKVKDVEWLVDIRNGYVVIPRQKSNSSPTS